SSDGAGEVSGGFDGADEFSDEAEKLYKLRSSNRRSFTFPPSNWESLHSQSRQFPPPTRASPLSSSFVSELSLVRLVLNALQGVESSLISIHKLSYDNPPKSELVASVKMKKPITRAAIL
ncbi:hypothetical protein HID58_009713, partial [Brassica napus]